MRVVSIIFLASLLFSSCLKDLEESLDNISNVNQVSVDPAFAAPLIKTRVTIADFLKQLPNTYVQVDDQNLIHLHYRGDLGSLKAKEIVSIPAQHYTGSLNLLPVHVAELTTTGSTNFQFNTIFNFGIGGTELDSILMKSCAMTNSLTSDFQHDVKVTVSIPAIKLNNNQALELVFNMPYTGSVPTTVQNNPNLSGSFFDLTKSGLQNFSQLRAFFNVEITKVGNNPVSTLNKIDFVSDFVFNEYDVLYGYVGEKDISPGTPDTLVFDVFKGLDPSVKDVMFNLAEPRIRFIISNSYGIPVEAKINEISTYSNSGNKVTATGFPDPLVIPVPSKSEIGQTKIDSFELNKSNSNLSDLVRNVPNKLIYSYGGKVNPNGTTSRNFITYNSQLDIAVDVDIPLYGSADGFVLLHSLPLTQEFEDIKELEWATLRLGITNDFPVDVDFQVYFADSVSNTILDSAFAIDSKILKAATVGSNGITTPKYYTFDIKIDRARFQAIQNANQIQLKAKLNTTKNGTSLPDVKFLDTYGIELKVGVHAKGSVLIDTKK
ncbi:MAG: hypothetical protein H6607_05920 [Flavobacteriales bacterium]|nr:hypothetical protein [Flavobacteriales bacterium]